jgi:hypothetical protein
MTNGLSVVEKQVWLNGETDQYTYHLGIVKNGIVFDTHCSARKQSRNWGWQPTDKMIGELVAMSSSGNRKACKRCQAEARRMMEAK